MRLLHCWTQAYAALRWVDRTRDCWLVDNVGWLDGMVDGGCYAAKHYDLQHGDCISFRRFICRDVASARCGCDTHGHGTTSPGATCEILQRVSNTLRESSLRHWYGLFADDYMVFTAYRCITPYALMASSLASDDLSTMWWRTDGIHNQVPTRCSTGWAGIATCNNITAFAVIRFRRAVWRSVIGACRTYVVAWFGNTLLVIM